MTGIEPVAEGEQLGPYYILRLIRSGGQASLYLAYDRRLRRRVAIKLYALVRTPAEHACLQREAQLVAGLQSPRVVQIYDVVKSHAHLGLVMEYVPGCSLEDFLQAASPSLASTLTVAADVAAALALAGEQHIVHSDVKASNVLITAAGRAKLTDFGIARSAASAAVDTLMGGSFAALSPEQLRGEALDERTDFFALGSLLYRMLTGEQPFFRHGQFDSQMLLQHSPPLLRAGRLEGIPLPAELGALLEQLLQKDPQDRPQTIHCVRQTLRRVSLHLPQSSRESLLVEAQPFFQIEPADDGLPSLASGFAQHHELALVTDGAPASTWRPLTGQCRRIAGVAVLVFAAAAVLLAIALHMRVTPVRIEVPMTNIAPHMGLPDAVSHRWLLYQVTATLEDKLGKLQVLGPSGAPIQQTFYAPGRSWHGWLQQEQKISVALHCSAGLCALALGREKAGEHFEQQTVLLTSMSLRQWQHIVRTTTAALFP